MKNHMLVNGRLLQMNKTWRGLKERQKAWIADLLKTEYLCLAQELRRPLIQSEYGTVLSRAYEKIQKREIWIPFDEVSRYFFSKVSHYRHSCERALNSRPKI